MTDKFEVGKQYRLPPPKNTNSGAIYECKYVTRWHAVLEKDEKMHVVDHSYLFSGGYKEYIPPKTHTRVVVWYTWCEAHYLHKKEVFCSVMNDGITKEKVIRDGMFKHFHILELQELKYEQTS